MGENISKLTDDDKRILVESFNEIKRDMSNCSVTLFTVLFTDYPDFASHFPSVGPDLSKFEAHCTKVMEEFAVLVKNFTNKNFIKQRIQAIAKVHDQHITWDTYQQLRFSLLKVLRVHMGREMFDDDVKDVWNRAIELIFNSIMFSNSTTSN